MLFVSAEKAIELNKANYRTPDLELYVRDVRDRQARRRRILVRSWSTIKDVKDAIQHATHIPSNAQRLYFGPLLTSGKQLPNHRSLHDVGIYKSGETLLMDIRGASASLFDTLTVSASFKTKLEFTHDLCPSPSVIDFAPRPLRHLIQQARRGFALGLKPEFILDGSGGSYFLHDARKVKLAVYKPADEEPYAENNPRGYLKQPGQPMALREGIVPGEACLREVAAFMLDHAGFSGVPMTTLVEARHPAFNTNGSRLTVAEGGASIGSHSISALQSPTNIAASPFGASPQYSPFSRASKLTKKVGSFQEFVRAECSMDDLSPSKISVDEVHKIAILDIRIMNADRNSANLLCKRRPDNTIELVPIDHGFCLRSVADVSWMDWCWLDWPQLKQPMSERNKKYIMNLDVEADIRMMKEQLHIGQEALDIFRASTSILQAGVKAGLTLYEIAVMCCRNDNMGEIPSKLEVLFSMASELASSAIKNGRWNHETASRALTDQLSPMGGSLLSTHHKQSAMRKSLSSFQISTFNYPTQEENLAIDNNAQKDMPDMIKSSLSDSSSYDSADDAGDDGDDTDDDVGTSLDDSEQNTDDRHQHDGVVAESRREGGAIVDADAPCCNNEYQIGCGEWAAALIADVSLEKSRRIMQRKQRSISIESEGSVDSGQSSGAGGFWHRAPGSDDDDATSVEGDDDSVSWSPSTSPVSSRLHKPLLYSDSHKLQMHSLKGSPPLPMRLDDGSFRPGLLIPPSIPRVSFSGSTIATARSDDDKPFAKPATEAAADEGKSPQPKVVSFGLPPKSFLSPSLPRADEQQQSPSLPAAPATAALSSLSSQQGMIRSKSFSALSSSSSSSTTPSAQDDSNRGMLSLSTSQAKSRLPMHRDGEQFRDYFLKFIDLVIVRETTAASRLSKGIF